MRRTTIFLTDALERDLKLYARRAGVPVASVVREAVEVYLVETRATSSRVPSFAGVGASGRTDTADRHEEQLWKDPGHAAAPRRPRTRRGPAKRRG
jgi:hypothetical protein